MDSGLKALIVEGAKQHPHAGPHELAQYVAQATPAADVARHYQALLVDAVRTVMNQERRGGRKPAPKSKNRPSPPPSPKLEQRRNWWQETLALQVHVGGGTRKSIAECDVHDLEFCIKERDAAIGRIDNQITNLRRLIGLMAKHGARTAGQLPAQQEWELQR